VKGGGGFLRRLRAEGLPPARGLCRVHRALRRAALQHFGHLRHGFHRLVFHGRRREAADVRRGDHARVRGHARRRHLVGRAAHVERAAGDGAGVQRGEQRVFIDQVAARGVDEERMRLHGGEGAAFIMFSVASVAAARHTT
jgi:hypothetical protein